LQGVRGLKAIAVALVLAVAFAVPAGAAVKRAKDRRAGVTFRLSGRHLTMKLSDQANARTVKKLVGKRVAAACGTSSTGGRVYNAVSTWPAQHSSAGVDLKRDISARAAYCLVEDATSGDDIALVKFRR
jgi:hypothetical protein